MWHPFQNRSMRVDTSQTVRIVKDHPTQLNAMASSLQPGRSVPRQPDYEQLIKQATRGAVVVIAVYMGGDTFRKCAINMSFDVASIIAKNTQITGVPTP